MNLRNRDVKRGITEQEEEEKLDFIFLKVSLRNMQIRTGGMGIRVCSCFGKKIRGDDKRKTGHQCIKLHSI